MNPKGSSPSLLDDKIMEAIRQGALRPVKITPLDYTQAYSLRMKLYRTRKKLILMEHDLKSAAQNVTIRMLPEGPHFTVIVQPKDLGFEQAFLNAGLIDSKDEPPDLD